MNLLAKRKNFETQNIYARLCRIYPADTSDWLSEKLLALARKYQERIKPRLAGFSEKDVFLITYADTILEDGKSPLCALDCFLRKQLDDVFGMVHLLPHFPFSSDDGFSVIDYRTVREDLGDWEDVARLAQGRRLVFDAVVNHASQDSEYIKGHCAGHPDFSGFAVSIPPETDVSTVLRTRNLPLLHPFETARGIEYLWTTFSADQVDLNFRNPRVLLEMTDLLFFYAEHGASVLRLDAIPYLWKELGTSCAHLPQTHEIIKLWRELFDLAAPHMLLLTETNVPHHENISYFGDRGDEAQIIYNFSLPPLLLWSIHKGDSSVLNQWAKTLDYIGPHATYLNLTASHDGIGMRPTEGLLSEAERLELCDLARRHGGDITGKRNADGSISVYELNITFFDALNDPSGTGSLDEQIERFVLSQTVPMALMGIPAFYLPSFLGSRNNVKGVQETGRARSINRPVLDSHVIATELADKNDLRSRVVTRLSRLLALRKQLSPFHPDASQEIWDVPSPATLFVVYRKNQMTGQCLLACHNMGSEPTNYKLPPGVWYDEISKTPFQSSTPLSPYSVRWLVHKSKI